VSPKIVSLIAGAASWGATAAGAATLTTNYTYDCVGRVTAAVYNPSSGAVYVTYCYDANGNRSVQRNSKVGQPTCPTGSTELQACPVGSTPATESSQLVPPAGAPRPGSARAAEPGDQGLAAQ